MMVTVFFDVGDFFKMKQNWSPTGTSQTGLQEKVPPNSVTNIDVTSFQGEI